MEHRKLLSSTFVFAKRTSYLIKLPDGEMSACLGATLTGVYRTNARLTRGLFSFTAWTIEVYHFLATERCLLASGLHLLEFTEQMHV